MSPLDEKHRVVYLLGPETVELREDPIPRPGPGELLVRIGAATTCGTDVKVFRRGGHPRMLRVPTPFGHELAGTIVECGEGASSWNVGQRVVVANSAPCNDCEYCRRGSANLCSDLHYLNGAFAEYILVPRRFVETNTHLLPDDLPFEIAALSEPLACVLHGVDSCDLDGAEDVAIYGAGPIGLLFVGVVAALGHRVVLADPNTSRLDAGTRLGATETVRIERGAPQAEVVRAHASRRDGFDVVVEATGVPKVWADAISTARPGGLVNLFGGCAPGTTVPLDTHLLHYSELTVKGVYHHRPTTFARAVETLASRRFDAGVLLSTEQPLAELESALRTMMRKEALKVVIRP
ncbi:MAG: alcohol dehydrogenase catalytic domain-containing protein [Planctomycetes bacterium]|nr:alcohol dehydrogenase catalytic domain-containing protein [Planctomycetota bacterium]